MNESQDVRSPAVPLLVVLGVVALASALVVYVTESQNDSFGDEPNYAPALLLLAVGMFLTLLAAIVSAGRRR